MASSVEITVFKNRTAEYSVPLYESNGTTGVALAEEDVVRVKIGNSDGTDPSIDLDSEEPTDNGSQIDITSRSSPATFNLKLAQGDLNDLSPGTYDMEILVVDASDLLADDESGTSEDDEQLAIKHAQYGVVHVLGVQGGRIGLD